MFGGADDEGDTNSVVRNAAYGAWADRKRRRDQSGGVRTTTHGRVSRDGGALGRDSHSSDSRVLIHLGRGEIFPELLQAFVGSEQRTEHRLIREQNFSSASSFGWHPHERIELAIAGFRERMRLRQVNRLGRENFDAGSVFCGHGVVR